MTIAQVQLQTLSIGKRLSAFLAAVSVPRQEMAQLVMPEALALPEGPRTLSALVRWLGAVKRSMSLQVRILAQLFAA